MGNSVLFGFERLWRSQEQAAGDTAEVQGGDPDVIEQLIPE